MIYKMTSLINAVLVSFITIFVYIATSQRAFDLYLVKLFQFYLVFSMCAFIYYIWAKHKTVHKRSISYFIFILSTTVLFLVGLTGWYSSPFFYLLYLLAILYTFIFSGFTTFVFIIILIGLFIPNIGSIDIGFDLVTIGALCTVVPLSYFLKREYQKLKIIEKLHKKN